MWGTVRLIAMLLATLGAACTKTVAVDFDEQEDFSHYRTWNWMPQIRPKVEIASAIGPALDVRLARLVEENLGAQGFERATEKADFYVTYHLVVRQQLEVKQQPVAAYYLPSLHSSPSYWIERSETVNRRYEAFRLEIAVSEGRGRMTWQAALEQRVDAGTLLPLDDAVETLIERFSRRAAAGAAEPD